MTKKVTFNLAAEIVNGAKSGILLGDFNNWIIDNGIELKKQKDGSLSTTVALEAGKTYQYRYLLNDGRWVNDGNAGSYDFIEEYGVDNCVITVEAAKPAKEEKTTSKQAKVAEKAVKAPVAKKPAVKAKAEKAIEKKHDDLTKIEGVGKKIAEILVQEGITDFAVLAKATPKQIKAILEAAGSRYKVHNPTTWPKQAKLAAAGKWEELKALQAELKGGK